MPKRNYGQEGQAVGTAIGSIWGPVGAGVGGAIGGVAGSLITSGSDNTRVPDLVAPTSPGGVVGDYGGVVRDPYTGLVTYTNNDIGTSNQALMRNEYLQDILMGGTGAGATNDLDAQIQFQQNLIERLSNPASSGKGNLELGKYIGQEWVGADGKIIDISSPNNIPRNSPIWQRFMQDTKGGNYGSKNIDIAFGKWLQDAYNNSIKPRLQEFENASRAVGGNEVVTGEALKSAQLKLKQLQDARTQFTGSQAGLANNPYLNYLNKPTDPRYQQDVDRWRGQSDRDFDQMQKKADLPFNTANDWTVAGFDAAGNAIGPNTVDWNAESNRLQYQGPTEGDYQMLDTQAAGALQDVYSRQAAEEFRALNAGRDENMARRGLLSSSVNEVARAGDQARLADLQGQARLRGLTAFNDTVGQNNQTASMKFQNQFNAELARIQGNQWNANFRANRENDLYGRAMGIDNTRYSRMNNEFGLKNQLEQQWRANALQSLGVQGGLEDRLRGIERQNYLDRMGFSDFLQGQSNNAFNQEMARRGMNLQQTGQGMNVNMQMANAQTNQQLANAQMQNSAQNAANMMGASRDQANANFFSGLAGNVAQAYAMRGVKPQSAQGYNPGNGFNYQDTYQIPSGSAPNKPGAFDPSIYDE